MLARYKIYRGKPPAGAVLPDGIRQDTRKHTRHCLRPLEELVERYLLAPSDQTWREFKEQYLRLLEERWQADRAPFDQLAELASDHHVFLGCSCPTAKNPDVQRCHTTLALSFMRRHYPQLDIDFP